MADTRERILTRIAAVAATLEGVAAVGRNVADVDGAKRPAIIVHDGSEALKDRPPGDKRSLVQIVEMTPIIVILVDTAGPAIGPLTNRFRARLLGALLKDAELDGLATELRYEGCELEPIVAESRQGRMEVTIVFGYQLRAEDFLSA